MKPPSEPFSFLSRAVLFAARSRAACGRVSSNTEILRKGGRACEKGALLVLLLPCVMLAALFLLGTYKVVQRAQQRIATQSRLDICAVRLIETRKHLARELVVSNRILRTTKAALYVARGLKIIPGAAIIGAAAEAALLALNRSTKALQDLRVLFVQGKELTQLLCAPTPYSKGAAFCTTSPALAKAFTREKTLQPDIFGPLVFASPSIEISKVKCRGGPNLQTFLNLHGDPVLTRNDFTDAYEK